MTFGAAKFQVRGEKRAVLPKSPVDLWREQVNMWTALKRRPLSVFSLYINEGFKLVICLDDFDSGDLSQPISQLLVLFSNFKSQLTTKVLAGTVQLLGVSSSHLDHLDTAIL